MTNAANVAVITICFVEQNGIVRAYSPELPGLHVCGKTRESVFADVPEVIKMLYKLNHKRDVTVQGSRHAAVQTREALQLWSCPFRRSARG